MSDSGGNSITIPDNVKKTIQSIREITEKKHSDEDVYSVLQECYMDPDDTAQKLLYLDTFHEVKRKCDWRKGTQGRGARGGQGNFSDAVGGRNVATRRENGVVRMTDRSASNSLHSVQKKNNTAMNPVTKDLTTTSCDSSTLSTRSSIRSPWLRAAGSSAHTVKSDAFLPPAACPPLPMQVSVSVMLSKEQKSTTFFNGLPASTSLASVSSSSDPILAPSMTRNPGAVGTIKREVGCQRKAAEQNNIQGNKKISQSKSKAVGKNQLSESLQPSTLSTYNDSLVVRSSANDSHSSEELAKSLKTVLSENAQAKVSSQLLPEPSITNGHVKFPYHFKVPEALKSGLTFGSFESNSGPGKEYINGGLTFGSFDSNSGSETKCSNAIDGDINSTLAVELTHSTVENARPSSNDSGSSPMQVDHSYQPDSPQPVLEKVLISEDNDALGADSKVVQSKQDAMLLPECHQNSTVQISPSYGFGIMPPLQAAHPVPFEGHETQAPDVSQLSGFVGENSMATSTSSLSQSMHPSVAASLHPLLFRPPYPPNYLQYGHYFNPYFLPPMHQFLSHNGLPQQPSTGNAFLLPAPAAPGVKFPFTLPQFKPRTTAGNSTPVALPTLYGSYGSSPMGFNPGPAVSSGSSAGNHDLSAFQLKERNIYTTGSLVGFTFRFHSLKSWNVS
ncbi:GBF-interacting protein 1-like isoform X2 [Populus alba x Populus x berolinensis]|uniref:GBF-interacting protein 1-like isoform X2 n=1 Tax=Populus alba x Populus x berolinensis TaxID=444605 RepID=A0AAD6M5L3_9ROSI|nr:GBF-interacting protein 1-like isoform X2 [Populus alba x Populus x berolinensis]